MTPDEISARMDGRITEAGPLRAEAFLPSPVVQNHAVVPAVASGWHARVRWFAGTLEGKPDIFIRAATLAPGAEAWSQPSQVSDDPSRSEQNPVLSRTRKATPSGCSIPPSLAGAVRRSARSSLRPLEATPSGWRSGPGRSLGLPLGSFVRARVVVRDDGAWLLPLFLCKGLSGARWTGSHDTAAVAISTDRGATWSLAEVPESTGCVHMTIVPLGGERMVAFFRRRQADFVYRTEAWTAGAAGRHPRRRTCRTTTRRSRRSDCPTRGSRCSATRFPPRSSPSAAPRSTTSSARTTTGHIRPAASRRSGACPAPRCRSASRRTRAGPFRCAGGRRRSGDLPLQRPSRRPQQGAILSGDGTGAGRQSSSRVHVPPARDQIRSARTQLDRRG